MNFGEYVRAKRKEAGYKQKELAFACGISTTYMNDIELGRRGALKVINAFGVSLAVSKFNKDYAYYLHGRLPPDLRGKHDLSEDQVRDIFRRMRCGIIGATKY